MRARHFLPIPFFLLALYTGWQVVAGYLADVLVTVGDGATARAQAAVYAPGDPRIKVAKGKYLLFRAETLDPQAGIEALREAVRRSPTDYRYWLELGRGYESTGAGAAASLAFQRAVELAPKYFETHWTLANFHLRQGRMEEAFEQFRTALQLSEVGGGRTNPRAARNVYQVLTGRLGLDPAVLGRVTPSDRHGRITLAQFLVEQDVVDPALAVMRQEAREDDPSTRSFLLQLLERTQRQARFGEAWEVWNRLRDLLDRPVRIDDSTREAIENGGFEDPPVAEELPALRQSRLGFDWLLDPHPQVVVRRDDAQPLQGNRSLYLLFAIPMESPYEHLSLLAVTTPGKVYRLRCLIRASQLPVDPPWIEIQDAARSGEVLAEVKLPRQQEEPRPLSVDFEVPAATGAVRLLLRTPAYRTVNSLERASLWLDEVSLRPVIDAGREGEP